MIQIFAAIFRLAVTFVSFAGADQFKVIGTCDSWLLNPALGRYVEEGTLNVGPIRDYAGLMQRSGVDERVLRRVKTIMALVKTNRLNIEPIRDAISFLKDEKAGERTLLCVGQADCRLRNKTHAALYV